MSNDQARKLLGGYATNSLTEAERKALFEAALDDQELFDALQQEEALKQLLADQISRNQIQQALTEAPVARTTSAAWWSRKWLWGGLAGAVAATVLIVAIIRSNQPQSLQVARSTPAPPISDQESRPVIALPAEAKPKEEPPPRKAMRVARAVREQAEATATSGISDSVTKQPESLSRTAAVPPPPPQPAPAVAPMAQAFRQELVRAKDANAPLAGVTGSIANFKGPLLQYSLAKRDAGGAYSTIPADAPPKPGDAIRLNVFSAVGGYLSLYQLDSSGDWKRLFPATDPGLLIAASGTLTIPGSPIIVTDIEQKFRLTLVAIDNKESAARAKTATVPLTVDITIAPSKIP